MIPAIDEQPDVGAPDGDQQRRDDRERERQSVQECALGRQEPEEHVHELHVQVALDVPLPGERRDGADEVVRTLDRRGRGDPAETAAQQEEHERERRCAAIPGQPPGERVQPDRDQDAQDVAVERERAGRIHPEGHPAGRRQVAQVVIGERMTREPRVLGRKVRPVDERAHDPEVDRPVAPEVDMPGEHAGRSGRHSVAPEDRPADGERADHDRRQPADPAEVRAIDRRRLADEDDAEDGAGDADADHADRPEPDDRRDGHERQRPHDHAERRAVREPLQRREMPRVPDEEADPQRAHRREQRQRGEALSMRR